MRHEETCCHSDSSGKSSVNAGVKNSHNHKKIGIELRNPKRNEKKNQYGNEDRRTNKQQELTELLKKNIQGYKVTKRPLKDKTDDRTGVNEPKILAKEGRLKRYRDDIKPYKRIRIFQNYEKTFC